MIWKLPNITIVKFGWTNHFQLDDNSFSRFLYISKNIGKVPQKNATTSLESWAPKTITYGPTPKKAKHLRFTWVLDTLKPWNVVIYSVSTSFFHKLHIPMNGPSEKKGNCASPNPASSLDFARSKPWRWVEVRPSFGGENDSWVLR